MPSFLLTLRYIRSRPPASILAARLWAGQSKKARVYCALSWPPRAARMRVTRRVAGTVLRVQVLHNLTRAKDPQSFLLRTFASWVGGDWALGITFPTSGHQRTSPAKVRDRMYSAVDGNEGDNLKSKTLCITALTLLTALSVPFRLAAQKQIRYTVTDLGTLGGTFSQAFGINNNGSVVGIASRAGDTAYHAFLWRKGVMTDLGTLEGAAPPAYSIASSINDNDEIVGYSETSVPDPLGENTCGDSLVCLPVVWRAGVISALPTLGGNNGQALSINDRGQVVGAAETADKDPTCPPPPQVLVLKPAIWEKGEPRALPTGPFLNGFAVRNNEKGHVVGTVLTCNVSAAYLWEKNKVINMGTLGGVVLAPGAINDQGQVTGTYTTTAGIDRGFLWQDGVAKDFGSLPGYPVAHGGPINDRGQIVGQACTAIACTVFLWQNGVKIDLNTVVPASSSLHMFDPAGINFGGEIVGLAIEKTTGQLRAFLAVPCDEDKANEEGWQYGTETT